MEVTLVTMQTFIGDTLIAQGENENRTRTQFLTPNTWYLTPEYEHLYPQNIFLTTRQCKW